MIRDIQLKDKDQWEKLYKGYADFYKVEMNNILGILIPGLLLSNVGFNLVRPNNLC